MCTQPLKAYLLNKQLMFEQEYQKLVKNKQLNFEKEQELEEIAKNKVNKDYNELENTTVIKKKGKNNWTYKKISGAHKIKRLVWNSSKKNMYYQQCYEPIEINCGKCPECRKNSSMNWAIRCEKEAQYWGKQNCCFITLTYNNENLPKDRGLHKEDLQKFFKRLRKKHNGILYWEDPKDKKTCNPIRYIAAGEYGNHTLRPHYHAIIFNWRPKDLKIYKTNEYNQYLYTSKELEEIWGLGFVVIGNVDFESCSYVAQYCLKKSKNDFIARQGREQEFIVMSRKNGIGCQILNDRNYDDFKIYTKKGVYEIPRFYKKKLNEKAEIENTIENKKYDEIGIIEIDGKKENCYKLEDNSIKKELYNKFEIYNNEHKLNTDTKKEEILHQTSDNEEEYNRKKSEMSLRQILRIRRNDC